MSECERPTPHTIGHFGDEHLLNFVTFIDVFVRVSVKLHLVCMSSDIPACVFYNWLVLIVL